MLRGVVSAYGAAVAWIGAGRLAAAVVAGLGLLGC